MIPKRINEKNDKLYLFAIFFCIICWTYRFYALFKNVVLGDIPDFHIYYNASRTIIDGIGNANVIANSSFGPPTTILGFVPFSFFSYTISKIIITVTNILCFTFVIFNLWKKLYGQKTTFFWIFVGFLAFCFPIIFSLGMGNPIGIVTLGIYIFWISKNIWIRWISYSFSVILKLFPLFILPFILLKIEDHKIRTHKSRFVYLFISTVFITIVAFSMLPSRVWPIYLEYSTKIRHFTIADPVTYNQSLSSTLARIGLNVPSFSLYYWILCFFLIAGVVFYILKHKNNIFNSSHSLEGAILFLAASILIHPFPWQHYFAVFVPLIMLEMRKHFLIPFIILFLISLDGGRIFLPGIIGGIMKSSQFIGTLFLYLYLLNKDNLLELNS